MKTLTVMLTDATGRELEDKAIALEMTAAELAARLIVQQVVGPEDQTEEERKCAELNQ